MMYSKRHLPDIAQWSQSSGSNVMPRRARPGLAGLRHNHRLFSSFQRVMFFQQDLAPAGGPSAVERTGNTLQDFKVLTLKMAQAKARMVSERDQDARRDHSSSA